MRVGEKETSEQAAIVDALRRPLHPRAARRAPRRRGRREATRDASRSRGCASRARRGSSTASSPTREDELENALLAARVPWDGEELPLRSAQARLAVEPEYARRDALGEAVLAVSASFNDERREPARRRGTSSRRRSRGSPTPSPATRHEKGVVQLRPILDAVDTRARREHRRRSRPLREHWLDRLLGPERDERPRASAHMAWIRRLSPLEATYTKERSVPVCLATLARSASTSTAERGIRTDLEDRPQKSPRACVIAVRPAARRPPDHPRTGRAPRLRGVSPRGRSRAPLRGLRPGAAARVPPALARPRPHRDLLVPARLDLVRARLARGALRARRRRGAARTREAARFSNTLLFRRYSAKLGVRARLLARFPSDGATPDGYEERLTAATGVRYPAANHLADMDAGFYSADYLRAWIRAAQLRAYLRREVGQDWWRRAPRPARSSATCSARGRGRRPRRSPSGSGSTRSTPPRSSRSSLDRRVRDLCAGGSRLRDFASRTAMRAGPPRSPRFTTRMPSSPSR